jgi:hypothetical protein
MSRTRGPLKKVQTLPARHDAKQSRRGVGRYLGGSKIGARIGTQDGHQPAEVTSSWLTDSVSGRVALLHMIG